MTSDKEFNKAALTAVICAFIIMTFVLLWRSGVDIRWADVLINLCIALLTAIISIFAAFALYKRGKKAEQKECSQTLNCCLPHLFQRLMTI